MKYQVSLETQIKVQAEYCDCRHCKGHSRYIDIDYRKTIEALTREWARSVAIKDIVETHDILERDLENAPFVILEPSEKILSPKSELYLLDRWNKGLGLPDTPLEYEYVYTEEEAQASLL